MTIDTAMVTEQQIFDELQRDLVESFAIEPPAVVSDAKLYVDLDLDSLYAVDFIDQVCHFVSERNLSPDLHYQ